MSVEWKVEEHEHGRTHRATERGCRLTVDEWNHRTAADWSAYASVGIAKARHVGVRGGAPSVELAKEAALDTVPGMLEAMKRAWGADEKAVGQ